MAIVRYLTDQHWPGEIYLLDANKSERDIIFREELDALAARCGNLHVHYTLTRAAEGWRGRRGRIDAALLRQAVPGLTELPAFICGPAEMIAASQQLLRDAGVPAWRVHT